MFESIDVLGSLELLFALLWWLAGTILLALLAIDKGRSGHRWFLLGLVLSPLVGFVALAAASDRKLAGERARASEKLGKDIASLWKQLETIRIALLVPPVPATGVALESRPSAPVIEASLLPDRCPFRTDCTGCRSRG